VGRGNERSLLRRSGGDLVRGRAAHRRRAWLDACRLLERADKAHPLAAEDLEQLAVSAYLIGCDEDYAGALARADQAHLDAGRAAPAARCAFWLGLHASLRGQAGRATGWLGRAKRVLDRDAHDCVERGYLMLPLAEGQLQRGRTGSARAAATRAGAIGERFRDHELIACARHLEGRALLAQRHVEKVVLVTDQDIRRAQQELWRVLRVVAEPGGAAAFAALLSGGYQPRAGERVGVVVCGGNTTAAGVVP
jgi:hypothetical protein